MTPQEIQDFLWRYEGPVSSRHTGGGARLVTVKVAGVHQASARTLGDAVLTVEANARVLGRPVEEACGVEP